jgi:hypothetical protein
MVMADEGRHRDIDGEQADGRRVLEGVARDAVVDDRLGHAERQEIEDLRQHDQAKDDQLFSAGCSRQM